MQFKIDRYFPPGPIAAAFIREPAGYIREMPDGRLSPGWKPFGDNLEVFGTVAPLIKGPVGSGKTNAMIFKALKHAAGLPATKRGVIEAKGIFVRQDYRTLYRTFMPTWHGWFPKDYPGGDFKGGQDRPATHELKFTTPRGRKIELFVEFTALGDNRVEDVLRGWEGTFAGLNETDLLERDCLEFLIQRIPRWPRAGDIEHGLELPTLVMGDLNPPGDPNHWIEEDYVENDKPGYKLFTQPSGLSPNAENIDNLPGKRNYYHKLAATMDPWKVQRFVHGKTGYDRSGLPVYEEYDPALNLSREKLQPIPGLPIHVGLDGYLHPAAIFVQRAPNLQLRVLRELYLGRIGPTRFAEHLIAMLLDDFRDLPIGRFFYDPSADYGADKEGGEQSWIEIIATALRKALDQAIPFTPAPSNEIPIRVAAVRSLLVMPITADARGLIVDPRCKMLIRGFSGQYRYLLTNDGKVVNAGAPRPDKNEFANPHDALQYVCLGLEGRAGAIATAARGHRPGGSGGATSSSNTTLKSEFSV